MTLTWKKMNLDREGDHAGKDDRPAVGGMENAASAYLLARNSGLEEQQKELLYDVLAPVFFGRRAAGSQEELAALFCERYGIDVQRDFYEGDEHYEEYQEAQQAIAEGMTIYGGKIAFEDGVLADLAERVWDEMERLNGKKFRRINTALEE